MVDKTTVIIILIAFSITDHLLGHNWIKAIIYSIISLSQYHNLALAEEIFEIDDGDGPKSKDWLDNRPIKVIYLFDN